MEDRKKSREQLIRELSALRRQIAELNSQRLESIGTLAGGIAHDYNNLLAIVMGDISLAKMDISPDDKAFHRLTEAEHACEKTKELTRQLLAFAKSGEHFRKVVSLKRLVIYATRLAIEGSNVKCRFFIPKHLFKVRADERQIRKVISDIVINAKEGMSSEGVVTIRAENISVAEGDAIPLESGNYIKISIEDTGRGIPGKNLSKIFDPYFTTKEMGSQKGMGLTLSLCYSIIKRHGGYIEAESITDAGTVFHIYLPAVHSVEAQAHPPSLPLQTGTAHKLVL
jgi:signal transduction histidine kinase